MDAETGLYDVKVDAEDPDGGTDSLTELGEFEVVSLNTDPSVVYIRVWGVPGGRLDPGGTIEQGEVVRMYSQVSDVETTSWDLSVNVSYRVQGGDWVTEAATYKADKDFWYMDWTIPMDAPVGLYDVKVDVKDPDGGTESLTELGEFEVI